LSAPTSRSAFKNIGTPILIMVKSAVNILLVAGFALAMLYVFVYYTQPSGASGAFAAAPGAGSALFAVAVAVLALFGLWQSKLYNKK